MKWRVKLLALVLATAAACGGVEETSTSASETELVALAKETVELMELMFEAMEANEARAEATGWPRPRNPFRQWGRESMPPLVEQVRDAYARDAWTEVFGAEFVAAGADPLTYLTRRKRSAEQGLERQRELGRKLEASIQLGEERARAAGGFETGR